MGGLGRGVLGIGKLMLAILKGALLAKVVNLRWGSEVHVEAEPMEK